MERVTYGFVLEADGPLAHHSESLGNTSVLMTRGRRLATGEIIQVPVVTADTMRHGLRAAAAEAFIAAAGLRDLSTAALRLLFAGGQITGSAGSGVSIREYHDMIDLMPTLGILGGCAGNRMVPGRLTVEDAILVSDETLPTLPPWVREWLTTIGSHTSPIGQHIEEATRVRMDPVSSPQRRALLAPQERAGEEARLALSERASETGDSALAEQAKSSMMPRTYECLIAGSLLSWQVHAQLESELERDTFHVMLLGFLSDAWVGGKRGTGHGHLVARTARNIKLTTNMAVEGLDVTALVPGGGIGATFRQHVAERAENIAAFLAEVEA